MSSRAFRVSHAGNLPRPLDLQQLIDRGDSAVEEFAEALPSALTGVVDRQLELGIDLINDGEYTKRKGFSSYVDERLSGIERRESYGLPPFSNYEPRPPGNFRPYFPARDEAEFRGFFATHRYNSATSGGFFRTPDGGGWAPRPIDVPQVVTGPVEYRGQAAIAADIAAFTAALQRRSRPDAFMCALGPCTLATRASFLNAYYPNLESLFSALADALRCEYLAIAEAGLIVQIDEPELARAWQARPDLTVDGYREYVGLMVETINQAVRGIPESRLRLHFCWNSGHWPHKNDIPLAAIMDVILNANVGCYAFEASNPRHAHEWNVFETLKLPEGRTIMPGVVGHASDYVEHPEWIAERLVRYGRLVGPENVIAGTDCGLGTRCGHAEITWAKLEAMVAGARLARRIS